MTRFPDLFNDLCSPFSRDEVKTRPQGGRQLSYITARTAMNRLDAVLGPENWWDEYVPGDKSVICKLTICLPDGMTITKQDAGGYAGMADQGDDDKSGFSDAFKRAAAKFGVARYLYKDGVPHFEAAPEPAPAHQPAPALTNNSGHGKGNFAPPAEVNLWEAFLTIRCQEWNGRWLDHWLEEYSRDGWPEGLPHAFVQPFDIQAALIKAAKKAGEIAVDGDGKHDPSLKISALIWTRDKAGIEERVETFLGNRFSHMVEKYGLILNAPPEPEDESDEPVDDEAILSTEGGREG